MDPPQNYVGDSQLVLEGDFPMGYPQVIPGVIYDPVQAYLDYISKAFAISFLSNAKNVKNPTQVIVDDTLYCMPNKHICLYLGQRILPPDGFSIPRVYVYLKYSDDKDKNKKVLACSRHCKNAPDGSHMLQSDNNDVVYEDNGKACLLNFAYPQVDEPDGVPSISFRFVCSSSCLSRAKFELNVELVIPDTNNTFMMFNHKHLVKVSSNPGRDSGQHTVVASQFMRSKSAFTPSSSSQKPRARKADDGDSQAGPSSKRSVSDVEQVQAAEVTNNNVYNLPIYGLKDYQKVLSHYNLLLTKDKYELHKVTSNAAVLNSQIPVTSDLIAWLETCSMKKYKEIFKTNGIRKMDDLHRLYDSRIFERLGVTLEDAEVLHCSFIYWRTSHLVKALKNSENAEE